jgi:ZIP family zinc transporter
VFVAGLITALATGPGAVSFFIIDDISQCWNVILWGLTSGVMLPASVFGLIREGFTLGGPTGVGIGLLAGVVLVFCQGSFSEFKPVTAAWFCFMV